MSGVRIWKANQPKDSDDDDDDDDDNGAGAADTESDDEEKDSYWDKSQFKDDI